MELLKEIQKEEKEVLVLESDELGHKVIVYNDDVNTFDWVIKCLVEICNHDALQSEQLAMIIHTKGKAIVKTGELNEMENIAQALCDRDLSAAVGV